MADEMTKTYSGLLIESLQKKKTLLEKLEGLTNSQSRLLALQDFDEEAFDEIITEKEQMILELQEIDEAFERIYQRVAEDYRKDKYSYEMQIKQMQELISSCMETGSRIQVSEQQNKDAFQRKRVKQTEQVRNFKQNSRVAANYYQHMANQHQTGNSYFMDKKK